ncbi:hypothetical protein IIV6-T1_105 [Invertebrate iridescent virus 6]|nr:hypothetical protein IIV6-T1_105 [Invertebrate iridescent virus 6]
MELYCKLIMVTQNNNNKYYEMKYEGGDTFTVIYGRVDQSSTVISKPFKEWDKIKNSKLKKGYKDVSSKSVSSIESNEREIENKSIKEFIHKMRAYTNLLVSNTYSVNAKEVSSSQISNAQKLLNKISSMDMDENVDEINELLILLYTCIPRKIKNVKKCILPYIDIKQTIIQEQDNLDALSSQLKKNVSQNDKINNILNVHFSKFLEEASSSFNIDVCKLKSILNEDKTFLEMIGITMDNLKEETNEINYIIDQLQKLNKKFKIYTVQRFQEEEPFNRYISESVSKKTRLLIHGTRCSSVIPILQTGLKIRPATSVHFSGKVYGEGNYFSEHVQKSLNYTGWDNDQILLIYEVHVGNEYIYEGWYNGDRGIKLNYNELLQNGYNSTYVKAGNGLQNSEIISYNEDQSKIKYIIHITK